MNKMFFLLSLWLAKFTALLISAFYLGQASNVPGRIALSLKKDLLEDFRLKKDCKIILITGTNGKSTTCGLLASILRATGKKVIYNKSGANLLSGIASTLSKHSNILGKLNYDFICLETDEATLPLLTAQIKPDLIAITNLFRDQLDRFGELDTTCKLIEGGINNATDSIILLNADDVRVAFLNSRNKKVYFGITTSSPLSTNSQQPTANSHFWLSDPEEVTKCPDCNAELTFEYKSIAHLGNYKCSKCNFKKPESDFHISDFKTDNLTINFDIVHKNQKNNFFLPMIGIFNLYNALCAIAVARTITAATPVQIQKGLQSYSTIFGRGERIFIKNKNAWIYLVKNPTGTTEVLKTLTRMSNARFLIALNDNFADGRDISWIWDARFDYLKKHDKEIFISGQRAYDAALRLKYAGVDPEKLIIVEKISKAVEKSLRSISKDETLYILPTYTVLLEMQKRGICKQ